ncbi:MAG: NAD(P)/FAD-dependent oxidoreductase [Alphaproteobacteria bacterium]
MTQSCDVAIAGGGLMGSAVAYFLAADPDFDGSVVVIERDPSYEFCVTGRSWGGFRQQFSTPENVRMSQFGIGFFRRIAEHLAVEGEAPDLGFPDLGFKEQGYLFLASESSRALLEANCAVQWREGATVSLLEPGEIAARFPWLNTEGIAAAGFGYANEGWIDPSALMQGFRRKARALGVEYRHDEVVSVEVAGKGSGRRVAGLGLRRDGALACGSLVNAAGAQAGALAAQAGAALPVGPRKRMTYVFDCRAALPPLPLIIDVTGVACRPESGQYLAIVSPPEAEDRVCEDFELEYDTFETVIWPALAHRIPAFEAIKLIRAWACHYDYNAFDQNAILGPHPEISGLMFCNGFSGHGIQQAPAAGRATAEWIVHGGFQSLDLTALLYARIAEGRPVKEVNVV